ncbi:CHASE3 domain-containing protein [Pedobacter sp. SD-b]|uniref:CHASE3 domain-containing protein n=1 Tax=Pedobacter segetis TaxID=2793069 RepID=A0ABS1BI82_9SPHI|nr:CHASE3 domain-containing protein [Pedobacter segetis]MBK0382476.1 CHASE3 domain-containing protein [Pedobacter segetis]
MKKVNIVYLLIIAAILSTSAYLYFSFFTYGNITSSIKTGEDKYDFLESSNGLILDLREAESFERGYIISKDSSYLDQYKKSLFKLKTEKQRFFKISESYGLTTSNPKEIERLHFLINQKMEEMDKIINLQKQGLNTETVELVKSDVGMKIMGELVDVFQNLYTDQKFKETQSKIAIGNNRKQFRSVNIANSIFVIIVLIMIAIYVKICSKKMV